MTYDIIVTNHAYWRAAERFRPFDTLLIEEEVRAALRAGRYRPIGREDTLLAFTEDGERVYALRPEDHGFVVVTALNRREVA